MFPLGWWRVVSFDLLGGGKFMFARMFPSATIAKVLFVRHYEASISTLRFVRRPRDFWIERHKLLWEDGSLWRLRWNATVSLFANMRVHQKFQSTQPKLWHGEGMNSLSCTGICRHRDQPNYNKFTSYVRLAECDLWLRVMLWCLLRLSISGKRPSSTGVKFLRRHCQKQNQCRSQTNLERLYKLRTAVFCKQILFLVEKKAKTYTQEVQ